MSNQHIARPAPWCTPATPLVLHHYVVDDAAMVVRGDLDGDTAGLLHSLLDWLMDAGHVCITVDLAGLAILCAGGITPLVITRSRCRVARGQLALSDPSPQVARILAVCGIAGT